LQFFPEKAVRALFRQARQERQSMWEGGTTGKLGRSVRLAVAAALPVRSPSRRRRVGKGLPSGPGDLTGYLEWRLVGLDLAALVAELAAVCGSAEPGPPLGDLLGPHRDAVLAGGLAANRQRITSFFLGRQT
jgi:hypothetical protein